MSTMTKHGAWKKDCVQQKCVVCWLHITMLFTKGSNTLLDQQLMKVNMVSELEAGEHGPWIAFGEPKPPETVRHHNYGEN